ncbi:MAG: lysine--tRNA ligase [Pyrinomonadaceae bacterium]
MTENTIPFIEDNDQTRARREHLDKIRELIGNAYPNKFRRTNVANSAEGEDTITAIVNEATITKLVNKEAFGEAFQMLRRKVREGARPTAEELEPVNAELNRIDVRVSGRLAVPPRVMGKAAFVHLSDGKERLQIYVRRDDAKGRAADGRELDGWELFGLLDHGDFIGVAGFLFVTKTGELSVHVREFEFLAKALLPMPDKLHGISDPEIRQRQRYADLIAGSLKIDKDDATAAEEHGAERELTTREVFERRSKIIREMRAFLDERGYIEVETPMLTPIASGAAARPFETTHNALGIKLYARIAPELYLKRLLVGGFERVYELNRNFRNEGIDRTHNPEFTMLEFYCAYMDVNGMMDLCEEMLRQAVEQATGGTSIRFEGQEFDFGRPFERLTMKEAINKYWSPKLRKQIGAEFNVKWLDDPEQVDFLATWFSNWSLYYLGYAYLPGYDPSDGRESTQVINQNIKTLAIDFRERAEQFDKLERQREITSDESHTGRLIVELFEKVVEHELVQPTFITDFPKPVSPLSKASPDDPAIAERFELFINGMECANGFSELNDPVEQLERFREQGQARERGDEEAMQMDTDYVRALAYGMPPAAGIGIGIDRIVMLLTNRRSIRDVILFPHMRPATARPAEETMETE